MAGPLGGMIYHTGLAERIRYIMRDSFHCRILCAVSLFVLVCVGQPCAYAQEAVLVSKDEAMPQTPALNTRGQEKAVTAGKEEKGYSFEYELDPYYTNASIIVNLTDQPIPDAGTKPEFQIYRDLFLSSYIPRYLVVEAAVFPMPVAGVAARSNANDVYRGAKVSDNLNLIKAVTAGFEEPYALSFFMGNVVSFTSPGEKHRSGNFGYMGYLVSIGDQHIKDNRLIKDSSVELEWKIKGDRKFPTHTLSWSFRVGEKLHSNRDIKDVIYIALRRSFVDYEGSPDTFFKNAGFEYIFDMDNRTLKPVRHYFTVDKKWPYNEKKIAFSMAVGFIWEGALKYTGVLEDRENRDNFQIILRPNLQF